MNSDEREIRRCLLSITFDVGTISACDIRRTLVMQACFLHHSGEIQAGNFISRF